MSAEEPIAYSLRLGELERRLDALEELVGSLMPKVDRILELAIALEASQKPRPEFPVGDKRLAEHLRQQGT